MAVVTLRVVEPEDLPVLYENQRDPASVELALVPARDREAFDKHWAALLVNPSVISRAIVADGKLAGHIGAWHSGDERQVGYWVGNAFRGRGVASQALAQLLAIEPVRPLNAHVAMKNVGSARVLEKCGFKLLSTHHDVIADLNLGTQHAPIPFVDLHYRLD
jgi:RimJ/RimL family protein N-acetyltransferase